MNTLPAIIPFLVVLSTILLAASVARLRLANGRTKRLLQHCAYAGLLVALSGCVELVKGERQYGVVVDAHTHQPIEGALVVVVWEAREPRLLDSLPAGAVQVAETFTDQNGQFDIPAWGPHFERYHMVALTIVAAKQGYGSHGGSQSLARPIVDPWPVRTIALPREGEWIESPGKIVRDPRDDSPEAFYSKRVSLLDFVLAQAAFGEPERRCHNARRLPNAIAYMRQVKRETGVRELGRDPELDLSNACTKTVATR